MKSSQLIRTLTKRRADEEATTVLTSTGSFLFLCLRERNFWRFDFDEVGPPRVIRRNTFMGRFGNFESQQNKRYGLNDSCLTSKSRTSSEKILAGASITLIHSHNSFRRSFYQGRIARRRPFNCVGSCRRAFSTRCTIYL